MEYDKYDFLVSHIERIFEIAGAYILCDAHLEMPDPEDEILVESISKMLKQIGFNDEDVFDVSALIGAKTLVSFYATVRLVFDEELIDDIWSMFVQLNARHRANLAVGEEDAGPF